VLLKGLFKGIKYGVGGIVGGIQYMGQTGAHMASKGVSSVDNLVRKKKKHTSSTIEPSA
jgi:hypothetical protein